MRFLAGGRQQRDATRREKTAATLAELDRTAKIVAQAAARKKFLHVGIVDPALRRRERRQLTRALLAEYREALMPLMAWFEKVETEQGLRSPLLAMLEKKAG